MKTKPLSRIPRYSTSLILMSGMALSTLAQQPDFPILKNNGVPEGPPAEVLPQNPIAHLQIQNLYGVIQSLEKLAKAAAPQKALPPQIGGLLNSESPVLAILGMRMQRDPFTIEEVGDQFGLDPQGTISVSLYLGDPRRFFVISLPLANPAAISAMIQHGLRPEVFEEIPLGQKTAIRLRLPQGAPIQHDLYIVCSDRQAYVCGDRSLALQIQNLPEDKRLNGDAMMGPVLNVVSNGDLSLTINTSGVSPLLTPLKMLRNVPKEAFKQQRAVLLSQMPAQQREMIEKQVKMQFKVRNLDEFADYVESFAFATYDELFDLLTESSGVCDGVSLALDVDASFPSAAFYLHSDRFDPEKSDSAISIDEVRRALSVIPGRVESISVSGKQPLLKRSEVLGSWLERVNTQLAERGLTQPVIKGLQEFHNQKKLAQPIEAKADWILSTRAVVNPLPAIEDAESLMAYGAALQSEFRGPIFRKINVIPNQDVTFLEQTFREAFEAETGNEALFFEKVIRQPKREGFFSKENRLFTDSEPKGVTRLTVEKAYITRSGFFGYNQHELINRKILLAKNSDGFLVYHQAAQDDQWLTGMDSMKKQSMSPAMEKLLNQLPAGVNSICLNRVLQEFPKALKWLEGLEGLIHKDFERYLKQVKAIAATTEDLKAAEVRIRELETPPLVFSLNRDPETSEIYGLAPGFISFPRNRILPLVNKVFASYKADSDKVGGGIGYSKTHPGTLEVKYIQSTEGITSLIRNVGNSVFEQLLGSQEQQMKLMSAIRNPRDFSSKTKKEIIVRNPVWEFIPLQGSFNRAPRAQAVPKAYSAPSPKAPIPPRSPEATSNQIDLSAYYNASLKDVWHEGGLPGNHLREFPEGLPNLGDIVFDARGIIQLNGQGPMQATHVRFPETVNGILINQTASHIHFLHATGWNSPEGTRIGSYVVHFENGSTETIPIVYGEHVRDWWTPSEMGGQPEVVWKGHNEATRDDFVHVYKSSWNNPSADQVIKSIDYHSSMEVSAPYLIGITVD